MRHTLTLLFLFTFSSIVFAQAGPVAIYHFNEGSGNQFQDSSGNAFHGTHYGTTYLPASSCVEGSCLFLDDHDVSVAPIDSWGSGPSFFNDNGVNGVTGTGWVYWDGVFHGPANWYFNKIWEKKWSNFDAFISDDHVGCILRDDAREFQLTSPTHFQSKTWVHVACVFNHADQTLKLYINGELNTEMPTTFNHFNGTGKSDMSFGNSPIVPGTSYNFTGRLDEVKFWDRSLTPAEVRADYTAHLPPTAACNNKYIEGVETCDGGQIWCTTQPGPALYNYRGTAACNSTCNGWQTCVATEFCGDNMANGNEVCDHQTEACTTPGGSQGTHTCLPTCLGWGACTNPDDRLDLYQVGAIHFPEKFGFAAGETGSVTIDVTKQNYEASDSTTPLQLNVIVRDETGAIVTQGLTDEFTFQPSSTPGVGTATATYTVENDVHFDDIHTYTLFASLPTGSFAQGSPGAGEIITQNNAASKTFVSVEPTTNINVSDSPNWMGFILVAIVLAWLFYPRGKGHAPAHTKAKKRKK